MIGSRIGHYEIVDELGAGGMGVVYRARDTRLGRTVALKALPADLASEPESLDRFEREAKVLAALNHPNIVTVHAVEEQDGSRFLAMELVDGRTLADAIPSRGMSASLLLELAIPLVDALAAAHEKGIVHRDLKPSNVMVTPERRVKVLDFGLARLLPPGDSSPNEPTRSLPLTREGALLGTYPYMSPEQVRGEAADARSDLFAFGCVLHEMATGRRTFDGASSVEVFHAILNSAPPAVDATRPELPHHLARIIDRCLEKDPRRRYQSALDVRNDLAGLAQELTAGGRMAAGGRSRSAAAGGRRLWIAGAVAVAIVGSAIAVRVGTRSSEGRGAARGAAGSIRSLAVLPFANLMQDDEQAYFVDGMQEALITDLSRIGTLRVISRTSTLRYRDADRSLPEIARELGVDAVVEGSVLRSGEQVRITAQLIHGATDEHLWAESYDRPMRDALSLLSEVARAIAAEIEVSLTPEQHERLAKARAVDAELLELLLRGRFELGQLTTTGFERALEIGRRVVELDSEWAEGHVLVASASILLYGLSGRPYGETVPEARRAAQRALEIDPDLSDAHNVVGWAKLYVDWDWEGAAAAFRAALALNPNNAYARHGMGDYLCARGRPEEALAELDRGRSVDPFSRATVLPAVFHRLYARRYDEMLEQGREALQVFPEATVVRWFGGFAHWHAGRRDDALAEWAVVLARDPLAVSALDEAASRQGPLGAVRWLAAREEERARTGRSSAMSAARLLAMAGDADAAFEWLDRGAEGRDSTLFQIRVDPAFDALRSDPRYRALLERMGLVG